MIKRFNALGVLVGAALSGTLLLSVGSAQTHAINAPDWSIEYVGDGQVRISASLANSLVQESKFAVIATSSDPSRNCALYDAGAACVIGDLIRGKTYEFVVEPACAADPSDATACVAPPAQRAFALPQAVSIPRSDSLRKAPRKGQRCTGSGAQRASDQSIWTCVNGKWRERPVVHPRRVQIPNYPLAASSASPLPDSAVIADVQECRLPDARGDRTRQNNNVGFPRTSSPIPVTGTVRFVSVPIDFPDAPGDGAFLAELRTQQQAMQNWINYWSGGRMAVEFISTDRWITAPQPSTAYSVGKPEANSYGSPILEQWNRMAQEFIDATGDTFNWNGISGVFMHFPTDRSAGIEQGLLGSGVPLRTPQGIKPLFYWGDGINHGRTFSLAGGKENYSLAALWIHELLHSMGAALHAPGNGFNTGVGQNQDGDSWAFNAWEMFKSDWLDDSQVYCAPTEKLGGTQVVNLRPLETPGGGYKTLIAPTGPTQALVVESRRPKGYSEASPSDATGPLVYMVDTTQDNDRSNEGSGADCGNDPQFSKWAYYLSADQRPISAKPPCSQSQGDQSRFFLRPGESVTHGGVRVTYTTGGMLDTIEVSHVA